MTSGPSLSEYVSIRPRFARSANLERDIDSTTVADYVPTGRALEVIRRLILGLREPRSGRAIAVTGPYGSGKSSLAVFIDALFAAIGDGSRARADGVLGEANALLLAQIADVRRSIGSESTGFIRATATAQREPVVETILRAIRTGIIRYAGGLNAAKRIPAFKRALDDNTSATVLEVRDIVRAITRIAPVLLVIDEFGKNLEHLATSSSAANDLYILQDLAEWTAGADAIPLVLLTFQHLAFEDYVTAASVGQRREWSKILGRFVEIPYTDSAAQAQALIVSVFEHNGAESFSRMLAKWVEVVASGAEQAGLSSALHAPLGSTYPLHPVVLAALPDLCARYGQNERTLFSFLAGSESFSVPTFLAETPLRQKRDLPSVRLDRVYDYFVESASTMVGASSTASRWLEIETRIRDALGLSDPERRVLKAIGVLNLISAGGALRASRALTAFACVDGQAGTANADEVEACIASLDSRGLVTYRSFADELRIWSGTDFDLKGAVERARARIMDEPPAALLTRVRPLTPIVASRHSQETGTLRFFDRQYVDRYYERILDDARSDEADGSVLLCIDDDAQLAEIRGARQDGKPVVVGFSATGSLVDTARELAAHLDVLNSSADIESDWVARRELRERAAVATLAVDTALEAAFGTSARDVRWMTHADQPPLTSVGGLSGALSELCDRLYAQTPELRNEMIARRELTSQGAKARRDLLEAMVDNEDKPLLGWDEDYWAPERAMYEAVLARPRIHRLVAGHWSFAAPPVEAALRFAPAWRAIEDSFDAAQDHRASVTELVDKLKSPPFGLKDGPIPVLVTAGLLVRTDDVALYEDGSFVTRLTVDVVERLARNPDRFAFKSYAIHGSRRHVITALGNALEAPRRAGRHLRVPSVVSVVAPLLIRARGLPQYAQRTAKASPKAIRVRKELFEAREPDELIFNALPRALELPPVPPRGRVMKAAATAYASALSAALVELESIYPELLVHIEESLARRLHANIATLIVDVRVRAERLRDRILEPQLKTFATALSGPSESKEDWLLHMGWVVTSKPVASWSDDDRARFDQQVHQLASAFERVEALHFAQTQIPGEPFDAARIGLTLPDGTDPARVVRMEERARATIEQVLDDALDRVQDRLGTVPRTDASEMLLLALAKRVLLTHTDSETTRRQVSGAAEDRQYAG